MQTSVAAKLSKEENAKKAAEEEAANASKKAKEKVAPDNAKKTKETETLSRRQEKLKQRLVSFWGKIPVVPKHLVSRKNNFVTSENERF